MKTLLFQVDGKLPNLALMKLAAWHRAKGDEVKLTQFLRDVPFIEHERAYASSIFEFSRERRARFKELVPDAIVGGDGYYPIWNNLTVIGRGLGSNLREVIKDTNPDEIKPDYSDYPRFRNSLGYTQRGCRLDCAFCRMKTREGEARKVLGLGDIWRGKGFPKNIVLLDNDFFGQPEWKDQLWEAQCGPYQVCFNQGINIRLINEEQAQVLSRVRYMDNEFQEKRLYTAWDNLGDERVFKAGVETLRKAGIPPSHLFVYMLVGFRKGETEAEIFYRFNEMVALGCKPYPMVFDRSNKRLMAFQSWVITGHYRRVPWEKSTFSLGVPFEETAAYIKPDDGQGKLF